MRILNLISIFVVLSLVCTSCFISDNNSINYSVNSNIPDVSSNIPNSPISTVSPTTTPDPTIKASATSPNTTSTTYVRKTPADILYNVKNIDEAQKKGLTIIEDQSFTVELNNWEKVRFISGFINIGGPVNSCYFLTDDNGSIIYMFPDFYGNIWSAYSIEAVSFNDINKDGLNDIIIIASYITGVGSTGAIPFPVCGIYFQKDKEFKRLPSLEEQINRAGKNQNISMVLEFLKGIDLDVPDQKTVNFSTFDINKKYFNDANSFVELVLKLPRLDGNYDGIPEINKYFVEKEKFFYDELPLAILKESSKKVEGRRDNFYRSADYKLEAVFGNIISISAILNGGAGGVGWAGIEGNSFYLNTGKKLSLGDIFNVNKDEYMNFIYNFVSRQIMSDINKNKQLGYGSGYNFDDAYSANGYKSIRSFDPNNFYLSRTALVVFYPKYALQAGAGGPRKFEIPFESILHILAIDISEHNTNSTSEEKLFTEDKEFWSGDWKRTNTTRYTEASLSIQNISDMSFKFSLSTSNGGNIGQVKGDAIFTEGNAVFKDNQGAEMIFSRKDGNLIIVTNEKMSYYGGYGVFFNGEYTKGKAVIKGDSFKEKGIFTTNEQEEKFKKLVGKHYESFLSNSQNIRSVFYR